MDNERVLSHRITKQDFTAHRFTPAERRQFETDGLVIIPDVLTPDEVKRLAALGTDYHARFLETSDFRVDHRFDSSRLLEIAPEFLNLIDHPCILPKIAELLGSNIYVYLHQFTSLPPTAPDNKPKYFTWIWHQDNEQLKADLRCDVSPLFGVKVAYFLSDVSEPGHGNMYYVPGSQFDPKEPPRDLEREHMLRDAVPLLVRPGSAVIFDTRVWHTGTPNESQRTRLTAWLGYGFRWLQRFGPTDDLQALRKHCDPLRAQLLDLDEQFFEDYASDRYLISLVPDLPLTLLTGQVAAKGRRLIEGPTRPVLL